MKNNTFLLWMIILALIFIGIGSNWMAYEQVVANHETESMFPPGLLQNTPQGPLNQPPSHIF